jgi:hypothetical protein
MEVTIQGLLPSQTVRVLENFSNYMAASQA